MKNTDRFGYEAEIALALLDFKAFETLMEEKVSALMMLHPIIRRYQREGLPEETIIRPIILKKIAFIKSATTKEQLQEILQPPKIRYFGGEIKAIGPYVIPEEELILWSRISPHIPLIYPAAKRYQAVFKEVFPEIAKEIGI